MAALMLFLSFASEARCAPANSLRQLFHALSDCVTAPVAGDSEITIVFSLKRDGALLGKPRISHAKLLGDEADQREFVRDVLMAFGRCVPVRITDELGAAIAGRGQ